jgi:hypothetical protein
MKTPTESPSDIVNLRLNSVSTLLDEAIEASKDI